MKFAKQYSEVYRTLPPTWPAFQYKALKKTISKVVKELEEKGIFSDGALDETLAGKKKVHVEYFLEGTPGNLEPCVVIHLVDDEEGGEEYPPITSIPDDDDQAVREELAGTEDSSESLPLADSKLSAESEATTVHKRRSRDSSGSGSVRITISSKTSKSFVEGPEGTVVSLSDAFDCLEVDEEPQAAKLSETSNDDEELDPSSSLPRRASIGTIPRPPSVRSTTGQTDSADTDADDFVSVTAPVNEQPKIKVFLRTDRQFFSELATAVNDIAVFETGLQDTFRENLDALSKYLGTAASPYSKDMYAWRRLLSCYLQSDIWLVNGVKDRPLLSTKEQLDTFDRLAKDNLAPALKSSSSAKALESFLVLNREMLAVKQFDEINHTAVRKILKKHDKRTQLAAAPEYTRFSDGQTFFVDNVARALIFAVQERLTMVVPQPEDYACPICQEISWKPIRLVCGHVFCVRCLVKAQVRRVQHCPICRADGAVENATPEQLDVARMNLLKLYFPKETKQKAKDNGQERAAEDLAGVFGNRIPPYVPSPSSPSTSTAYTPPAPPHSGSSQSMTRRRGSGSGSCVVM
ncbi:hypothetical protein HDU87_004024 [Geranomyces variabilis]|uniref:SPX domain-containing protein n=1 Tax=Geranomyces variabilis TaxID=109894 RepID=A0AAD5TQV3_9FUNG|nr:hypothetical protein HDU87_004024 [Geranomyces variabilis]